MVIIEKEKEYLEGLIDFAAIEFLYTIVFSAKESLFKAIFPLNQEYFDFKEAVVKEINLSSRFIDLEIISERESLSSFLSVYRIQYGEINGSIITLLIL